ncbi:hypothetical protein BDV95DRAFT_610997 [Massariosphaeria phaeospora]|uniref:Uncharacterized protein n=1 Tax=Massariosphaeria phaeospora TaxID=100035 RepID=A0A7C8MHC9_9PLEO|nr:hypothetical protein BDV95DRAFT_610997 [Massariosphaeria phaeospora]
MSGSGVNRAVTTDGGLYNRLRRPDDYAATASNASPPEDLPAASLATAPSTKRSHERDSASDSGEEPEAKRTKNEETVTASLNHAQGRSARRNGRQNKEGRQVNEYGMQTMFPGIDDVDSSDDATRDALAYLRSVRSEAAGIPNLLCAPPPALEEDDSDCSLSSDGRGEASVVYTDGTWIAFDNRAAGSFLDDWSDHSVDLDPQEQYYKKLLLRYMSLRRTLAHANPGELAERSDDSIEAPRTSSQWQYALNHEYPTPARLCQLDERGVWHGLGHCARSLQRQEYITKRMGCWIWALLAVTREIGTLEHWKVGWIRDLGFNASRLGSSIRSGAFDPVKACPGVEEIDGWDVGSGVESDCGNGIEDSVPSPRSIKSPPRTSNGDDFDNSADMSISEADEGEVQEAAILAEVKPLAKNPSAGELSEGELPEDKPSEDKPSEGDLLEKEEILAVEIPAGVKPLAKNPSAGELSEGELSEDKPLEDKPSALQEARARLLAQLGDRLIQPQANSLPQSHHAPSTSTQFHHRSPRKPGRHRHNGKVCTKPSCGYSGPRRKAHQKAGLRAAHGPSFESTASTPPAERAFPSREEAERQRQHMREQQLVKSESGPNVGIAEDAKAPPEPTPQPLQTSSEVKTEVASPPPQVFHTRTQAEAHRSQEIGLESPTPTPEEEEHSPRNVKSESQTSVSVDDTAAAKPTFGEAEYNTRFTIDMILTVVGECYGQRDLLECRGRWAP